MDVKLKNYTSRVPVHQTISYIEAYLASCEVSGITKQYEGGVPAAIFFHIDLGAGGKYSIRLPAKVAQVHESLWNDYVGSTKRPRLTKKDFAEQAARTAWKIVQDWVQVQMTLIKLKQADFLEVFMGFVWTGRETYYQQEMKNGRLAGLIEYKEQNG